MKKLSQISPAFDRTKELERVHDYFGVTMELTAFTFAKGKYGAMAILHVNIPSTGTTHKLFIYSSIVQEQLTRDVARDELPVMFTILDKGEYHTLSDPIDSTEDSIESTDDIPF